MKCYGTFVRLLSVLLLANVALGFGLPHQISFKNKDYVNDFVVDAIKTLKLDYESSIKTLFSENLISYWNSMSKDDIKSLSFLTKPISKIVAKKNWDFVEKKTYEKEGYQLRVNKVKDPKVLGIDPGVKQYSGYLDVEEEDKHFFYWFFESRNDPENDPVVLWLNGGPGCSSMTGLFFELGSSSIDATLKPVYNDFSWNKNASVIFLDQPVNAGFSYSGSKGVSNTVAAGKDVFAFLDMFFHKFPQYAKSKFHIAGESYAGHYIPVIASEILSHTDRHFNLTSVMIGNGLTDPLNQYPYYQPMACGKGGADAVLSEDECQAMTNSLDRCLNLIESCYKTQSVWACVPASIYCNNNQLAPYQKTGKNVYDIRKNCEDSSLCYKDLEYVDEYLNQEFVQNAIGAEVKDFQSCNFEVNRNFLLNGDWMKPYQTAVTDLLEQDLPVLIYAGDKDFICNWLGNQHWTDVLPWKYNEEFNDQSIKNYKNAQNEVIGESKSYKHFTFLRLFNGGHMVPYDQPQNALTMLNDWIHNDYQL